MNGKNEPDVLAQVVGHAAVAAVAAVATHKISNGSVPAIIVVAVVAVFIHVLLDAPATKLASNLGL
ncbi:MAG: hypothetical protein ACYCV5_00075 [Acidimicrobiales bacterium]|jgi:hypothetical protein